MQELRGLSAAHETSEANLPAGGREQIVAADHVRDALHEVVDGGDELIGPVAGAVADEQVAALLGRLLLLRSLSKIHESLHGRLEPDAQPDAGTIGESTVAAGSRVPQLVLL